MFHIVHIKVAHAPLPDFSFLLQFHQSTDGFGERIAPYPVQQIKVDVIRAEPLQASFASTFCSLVAGIAWQYLADDERPFAATTHGFAHKIFRAIHLGGIYQCQA